MANRMRAKAAGAVAGLLLALSVCEGANLSIRLDQGSEKVALVGAFQRWDLDGNPTRQVNPKAQIERPEVDLVAERAGGDTWVFAKLKPGKYDLVILCENRLRVEGWEYAPVLEFDPFFPPSATVADASVRETIVDQIKKARHYENKVLPLYLGGDEKAVRALMMLIRDQPTSYESEMPGAATMRFEIWQYDYQYGGWTKHRRTRVMHRVILPRDELRRWTWLWDAKLGAIEVKSENRTIDYQLPQRGDKALGGLRPY